MYPVIASAQVSSREVAVPDSGQGSILFDVFVLGQRLRQLLAVSMASSPLRPEEYAVYSVVFEDEAVSPTAMASRLSMPLTTIMDHVRVMEARGDARRLANPRDGRSYLVTLTAAGLRAHREANVLFERVYRELVAALPEPEGVVRAHLAGLLAAVERAAGLMATSVGGRSRG